MPKSSPYAISSVDTALRMALVLQAEGPLRSSELADRLGVARSTAHRLLTTLVNRGFAEQCPDKRYNAGPVLRAMSVPSDRTARLRAAAWPRLEALRDETGETVSLEVLSGTQIKYLVNLESPHVLTVSNREGWLAPAWVISGGRALLAQFPNAEVRRLLSDAPLREQEIEKLLRSLALIRKRGFALNDQSASAELGVTAVARPLRDEAGTAIAAVSVAMPSSRFSRDRLTQISSLIAQTVTEIERRLTHDPVDA